MYLLKYLQIYEIMTYVPIFLTLPNVFVHSNDKYNWLKRSVHKWWNYKWKKNISMLTDKGCVKYIIDHKILPNVKRFRKILICLLNCIKISLESVICKTLKRISMIELKKTSKFKYYKVSIYNAKYWFKFI